MKNYDVIIVGGGAAGLMCAIEAGKRGRKVLVLEKSDKVGKKILISGGGRCNFTNMYASPDDFLSNNPHFCKSALSRYSPWDFIALMEKHGLSWTEKTLGQLFCDQKSGAVVDMLIKESESAGVFIQLDCEVRLISNTRGFLLETSTGDYMSSSLVIASGGPSIPRMGATDFALQIAKQFSLKNIPFSPALVPFTFNQDDLDKFIKDMSGISIPVELCVVDKADNKIKKCFKESILFTHRGISGPAALQISSYWHKNDALLVNLFPDENAFEWLQAQQQEHPQAGLKTILGYKLPKRLANALCEFVLQSESVNKVMQQFKQQDLEALAERLTKWQLKPSGTEGMRTAEVSLGGVNTDELSSKTFETKSVKGLYFIGESVDITGHLGGFNFQWAWASGWSAGQYV